MFFLLHQLDKKSYNYIYRSNRFGRNHVQIRKKKKLFHSHIISINSG